jgi:hypothetical protein
MPSAVGDKVTCPVTGVPGGATVMAVDEESGLLTVQTATHGLRTGVPDPKAA